MNNINLDDILFKEFYKSSLDAIVLLNLETNKFVFYNENALKLYEYTEEEFQEITPYDLTLEFINNLEMENKQEFIFNKGWDKFITKHKTKSGQVLDVFVKSRKINYRNEQLLFITLINLNDEILIRDFYQKKKNNYKDDGIHIILRNNFKWNKKYNLLTKNDNDINLTNNEKLLISFLIKNLNKYLTFSVIQMEYNELSKNAILSLVKRIRKKTSKDFIENIQNRGYIIKSE